MSKRYGRALAAMVRGLTAPQHPWRRANTRLRAANALFQTHEVATRHGPITFISTHPEALHYPRELVGREPETIDWIDGFEVPCTFWDVGANVGAYTLYAALAAGHLDPGVRALAGQLRRAEPQYRGERQRRAHPGLLPRAERPHPARPPQHDSNQCRQRAQFLREYRRLLRPAARTSRSANR